MALTKIEKKYLELAVKSLTEKNMEVLSGDIDVWAEEMGKSQTVVRNYVNSIVIKHNVPDPSTDKPFTQSQTNIRNLMAGQTAGGRDGITVMSDASSSIIEGVSKTGTPPNKHDRAIFRGNPRPKR